MSSKPLKVVFAPGCFDSFEGTQEELDALTAEIQNMFAGMTSEELAAQSREISLEALAADLDDHPEIVESMLEQMGRPRRLQ